MNLWEHQKTAVKRAKGQGGFALFFEQGCGKTATLIHILQDLYTEHRKLYRTLILCPPIVVHQWANEFERFSDISRHFILPLSGPTKKRIDRMQSRNDRPFIGITNYEGLVQKPFFEFLKQWRPEVLVLDESHYCKDMTAKRTKNVIILSDKAKHVYLASGTPILNTPLDIFSQWRIMDGGKTFGRNWFVFRARYFHDLNAKWKGRQNYFPNWQPKTSCYQDIKSLIAPNSMRVTKKQCLDLPPLIRQKIEVPMSEEQRVVYESLKRDFLAYVGDKTVVADMALTKLLRLQQVVSGVVKFDDGDERIFKNAPRIKELKNLLSMITPKNKVIVWAVFKQNYKIIREICTQIGVEWCEIHGEITNKKKEVEAFTNDPKKRVLIGHPKAGGVGVNLIAASYAIFYSRNFSLENDLQARARNHRGGSEIHDKITQIDLITPGSVDEGALKALEMKDQNAEKVLSTIRGYL